MNTQFQFRIFFSLLSISIGGFMGNHATADEQKASNPSIGGVAGDGATIKGIIKFKGKQVARRPIKMGADKNCVVLHPNAPALDERWVFGNNDTLQNVFVWVSAGIDGKKYSAPQKKAVLDQVGCVYSPHVIGVVVGQQLEILNSDATLHNVNLTSKENRAFNDAMPVKGMKISKKFGKPEIGMALRCNVHPWMVAYTHAIEHPFFAVTQKDGTFELRGLPPGKYTVSVWHEFRRFEPDESSMTVNVTANDKKELTFNYSPVSKKSN